MIRTVFAAVKRAWKALTLEQWDQKLSQALNGVASSAGPTVSADSALKVATVYSCVRVLAESVATLPLFLYQRDGRRRERAIRHPIYRLLHDAPNPEMTAVELREAQMINLLLRGRAYARKVFNGRGDLVQLWPISADLVTERRPHPAGARVFDVRDPETGKVDTLSAAEIWRVNGMTWNGLIGLDPISYAREAVGTAMAQDQFGARTFQNGARPGGVLEHPGKMKDDEHKRFKDSWKEAHEGPENAGKTVILENDMKYHPLSMTMENAQWIEGRRFSVAEICRIFRVPLHMVYDHDTQPRANQEQSALEFVVYSLRPWLVRIEQSVARDLIATEDLFDHYAQHLVDGLLRGDFRARQDGYSIGRLGGWLSANDILETEDRNPIPNGDDYWRPANMVVVGQEPAEPDPDPPPVPGVPPVPPPGPSDRENFLLAGAARRCAKREIEALRRLGRRTLTAQSARELLDGQALFVEEAMACPAELARAYADRRYDEVAELLAQSLTRDQAEQVFGRWDRELPARILEEVARAAVR